MKYCSKCGTKVDENISFCPQCGNNIAKISVEELKEDGESIAKTAGNEHRNKKGLMPKVAGAILAVAVVAGIFLNMDTISAMFSNNDIALEYGQYHYIFDKEGGLTMSVFLDEEHVEDMGINLADQEKEISDYIQELVDGRSGGSVELVSFKKQGNSGLLEVYVHRDKLEDYYDYGYFEDFDDMADQIGFVFFNDEKDVNSGELEEYKDYKVFDCPEANSYYTFSYKIMLVDKNVKFTKIDDFTIFVDSFYDTDGQGLVVYKDY